MTPPAAALEALGTVMASAPAGPVGVAVSGGSDSTALLLLLRAWARREGRTITAITVDHGLRPESAGEAGRVSALCARLGVAHQTRRWSGWDGKGNLQDAARRARRTLIGGWADDLSIRSVALGHTLDDQAETVLLRLARGSGVDGLSAMAPVTPGEGLLWLRPLLTLRRQDLRDWLTAAGVDWIDDPSNADPAFDRVRARAALVHLAAIGLGPERLAATADQMARARTALEMATAQLARAALTPGAGGDLMLATAPLAEAPRELQLRLLAGALGWVAGAVYRPRLARLEVVVERVLGGRLGHGVTFHGCMLRPSDGGLTIRREPARVGPPVPLSRRWDNRWEYCGTHTVGAELRLGGLGATGLAHYRDWRRSGLARETLMTTPALWRGDVPVAAPLLQPDPFHPVRRVWDIAPPWVDGLLR